MEKGFDFEGQKCSAKGEEKGIFFDYFGLFLSELILEGDVSLQDPKRPWKLVSRQIYRVVCISVSEQQSWCHILT